MKKIFEKISYKIIMKLQNHNFKNQIEAQAYVQNELDKAFLPQKAANILFLLSYLNIYLINYNCI